MRSFKTTEAAAIRELVERHSSWIPDLFAALYVRLSKFANEIVSQGWAALGDDDLEDIAVIRKHLERWSRRGEVPREVQDYLCDGKRVGDHRRSTQDPKKRGFFVACAIDRALEPLHPAYRYCDGGTLSHGMLWIRDHVTENDVFNRKRAPAMVIPKMATRAIPGGLPRGDRIADCFIFVAAVAAEIGDGQFKIRYRRLPRSSDFPSGTDLADLRVGLVPVAETRDDLSVDLVSKRNEKRLRFRIPEKREKPIVRRLRAAIRSLHRGEPTIIVLPEFIASGAVRTAIRQELRRSSAEANASVSLVAAGSGLRGGYSEMEVYNARGEMLWIQQKLHHNVVEGEDAVKLGVGGAEVTGKYREDLHTGTDICVVDSNIGRIVIFICEDFNQPEPANTIFDRLRPDWVLVPILDKTVMKHRWYHRRACEVAERYGTRSIISNSLAFSTLRGTAEPDVQVTPDGTTGGFLFGLLVDRGLSARTLDLPRPAAEQDATITKSGPDGRGPNWHGPRFAVAHWRPNPPLWTSPLPIDPPEAKGASSTPHVRAAGAT